MINRWVNPPPTVKDENEFPQTVGPQNEFPPQDVVTYSHTTPFNTIKKQVRKKKINKKTKKDRLIEKALGLSGRLGKL